MNWTTDSTGYMGGVYSCDKCHKSTSCANGRWACLPCKYDACPNCFAPPPPPVPMTAFIQCNSLHPLVWSTDSSGYMMGKFSCDTCKKTSDAAMGRWTCAACKYDVCPLCRPPEAPVAPPVPFMAYLQCNTGHPLVWSASTGGYMMGVFACDTCKKGGQQAGIGRWCCPACKYDICHACRPPADENCTKGHKLVLSIDSAGYMMGKYSCDKCHKSQDCSNGRYTCPCKYDVCPTCKSS